jgi:hypothetical protein
MKIAEGRQQALDDNWKDRVRLEQGSQYQYDARGRQISGAKREDDFTSYLAGQEAASYLAPLLANQQRAVDLGISDAEWVIQQRNLIMSDPQFLSKPAPVQQMILDKLGETATRIAQSRYAAGGQDNIALGQKILDAYGRTPAVNPLDAAISSGNAKAILEAANAQGAGAVINPDGTVTYGGQKMSGLDAVAAIIQSRNAGGFAAGALNARNLELAKAEQQKALNRQYDQTVSELTIRGYTPLGNGLFKEPTTGQTISLPPPEGYVPSSVTPGAAGAVPATPGAVVPGAVVPGAVTPAGPSVPYAAQLHSELDRLRETNAALALEKAQMTPLQAALAQPNWEAYARGDMTPAEAEIFDRQKTAAQEQQRVLDATQGRQAQSAEAIAKLRVQAEADDLDPAAPPMRGLALGYANIGVNPTLLAAKRRQFPGLDTAAIASLERELARIEAARKIATGKALAELNAYMVRVTTALGNFRKK